MTTLNQEVEPTDGTNQQIAEQIAEGYTSGHLIQDSLRIHWEIKINIFE